LHNVKKIAVKKPLIGSLPFMEDIINTIEYKIEAYKILFMHMLFLKTKKMYKYKVNTSGFK
jgi:hypothetical protein